MEERLPKSILPPPLIILYSFYRRIPLRIKASTGTTCSETDPLPEELAGQQPAGCKKLLVCFTGGRPMKKRAGMRSAWGQARQLGEKQASSTNASPPHLSHNARLPPEPSAPAASCEFARCREAKLALFKPLRSPASPSGEVMMPSARPLTKPQSGGATGSHRAGLAASVSTNFTASTCTAKGCH